MESGTIEYTSRAHNQDAGMAMRGDIVRGLIEFITNADDAYADAVEAEIKITILRPNAANEPTTISVSDTAKGLSPEDMKLSFCVLGGRTSGFANGGKVRGHFGRGSKDVAVFGRAIFESIKDNKYSIIELQNGKFTFESRDANESDQKKLGLINGKNGLTARIVVLPQSTIVPEFRRLIEKLSKHIQLRQILVKRKVTIIEFKNGRQQTMPLVWENPLSTVIFEKEITLPNFGSCMLLIEKMENRVDGPVSEYSLNGIEIRGEKPIYMNTMFSQVSHGVGFIRGFVTCPQIEELIRNFENQSGSHSPKNPFSLIRRDRDGLSEEHPFFKELSQVVIGILKPLLDQLEPKVTDAGSSKLKRDLNKAAKLLSELLQKDLGDDNDDPHIGGMQPTPAIPIIVIPPRLRGVAGTRRTLTVLVHRDSTAATGIHKASSHQAVSVVNENITLSDHPNFPDVLIGQIHINLVSLGSASVVISAASDSKIYASAEVVVHNDPQPDDEPPTTLEWKNKQMSVSINKDRTVILRAPIELAPSGFLKAKISLLGDTVELLDQNIQLELSKKGWLIAKVRVRGLKTGASSKILATAGFLKADGIVSTSLPSVISGLNFEIQIVPETEGPYRGRVEKTETGYVLKIFAQHIGLSPYIGTLLSDGSFSGETEVTSRVVLAEIIASIATEFVMRTDAEREPNRYSDIDMSIQQRTTYVTRYLKVLVHAFQIT